MGMTPTREEIAGMRRRGLMLAMAGTALAGSVGPVRADDDAAARAARWQDLRQAIFGNRPVRDGSGLVQLDAPGRALDASLVPVAIRLTRTEGIKGVYLVIDNNPSPLAAHVTFGPEADPHALRLRVRVNDYTDMHAVAETADGTLYAVARYVKAAGGCSAPAGPDDEAALRDLGRMKLRLAGGFATDRPVEATLMIRHPNFNGMQMNQLTRLYTPARYIQTIDVAYDGGRVFHMDTDISLASDPVIGFGFLPTEKGVMQVVAKDSKDTVFRHSFPLPPPAT